MIMKHYNSFIFNFLNFYIVTAALLLTSCTNIVDYDKDYTPAEHIANSGAPTISAVYDVADTELQTPITEGNINQMVRIVGTNLNNVKKVTFNTVEADLKEVYTASTSAVVRIPSALSMEHVNKIEYTTEQGTTVFDFVIPFPTLTVSSLLCEFVKAGEWATVYGENFDIYQFGTVSKVCIGEQELAIDEVTSTSMKVQIPAGTPDNSTITFRWTDSKGEAMTAELPFRPTAQLLYGDMSDLSMSTDGPVVVAKEEIDGMASLHFTGSYDAWSWNTIDLSRNMIDQTIDNTDDYVLKFEVKNATNFPLTEDTGLKFAVNWGSDYGWNPAGGSGINTFGRWQTVSLPLSAMASKGIVTPGTWMTMRIIFQPHAAYEADFQLANFRFVRK